MNLILSDSSQVINRNREHRGDRHSEAMHSESMVIIWKYVVSFNVYSQLEFSILTVSYHVFINIFFCKINILVMLNIVVKSNCFDE